MPRQSLATPKRFSNRWTEGTRPACRRFLWWSTALLRSTRHQARSGARDRRRAERDCGPSGRSVRDGHGPVRNVGSHAGSLAVRWYAPGRDAGCRPEQSAWLLGAAQNHLSQRNNSATQRQRRVRPVTAPAGGRCVRRRREGRLHRRDPGVSHHAASRATRGHQGPADNAAVRHVVPGGASGRIRHRGRDRGAPPSGGHPVVVGARSNLAGARECLVAEKNLLAERRTRAVPVRPALRPRHRPGLDSKRSRPTTALPSKAITPTTTSNSPGGRMRRLPPGSGDRCPRRTRKPVR